MKVSTRGEYGVRAMVALPIDASPDVTPNVVTIVTDALGLGPIEVEKLITFPIEVTMRGLPGIKEIRSISRFGLSSVSVYFEEQLDLSRAVGDRGTEAEALLGEAASALDRSSLPDRPDAAWAEEFLVRTTLEHWRRRGWSGERPPGAP